MDLTEKTLWQVGAGDTDRSYGELCTRFDVMIMGPGDPGEYSEELYADVGGKKNSLRRFCMEARRGDVVLLRLGTNQVLAVGEIADCEPSWSEAFSDVDGWDLQHFRRVRWFSNTSKTFPIRTFGGQAHTFAKVGVNEIRSWVASLSPSQSDYTRELGHPPKSGKLLTSEELGRHLFIEGLPSEHVDHLLETLSRIQRVASWYWNKTKRPEGRPSEHETVSYLVIPLLLSLGWSEQTAAIEWRYIDVALFNDMPPTDDSLSCIVEAKLLDRSVFSPTAQAYKYAEMPGRSECNRLIVTDGIRYALHRRSGSQFSLDAYLNLLCMRDTYPVLGCGGAVDAILGMAR